MAVSYTHLDVYKRQVVSNKNACFYTGLIIKVEICTSDKVLNGGKNEERRKK